MLVRKVAISSLASLGLALGVASSSAIAQINRGTPTVRQMPAEETVQTHQFRRIEQPLWVKGAVAAGGLTLIGLELWWFLFSKPKSQKAATNSGVQEIAIIVDGGYEPSRVVAIATQPVRLNFLRRDESSCLEEVRLPDFHIARKLPLNQVTSIEFKPDKPGIYTFTCGMNMFRGFIEIQPAESIPVATAKTASQPSDSVESAIEATATPEGIQEATVAVEKGYQPGRIIVEAGRPVRLRFQRNNPSKCLEKLLLPDFDLAVHLALNQTTTVEFTPKNPGEYEFTCGMKMYRGVVEVRSSNVLNNERVSEQVTASKQ